MNTEKAHEKTGCNGNRAERFDELMEMARRGNMLAVAELFLEYDHCYYAAPKRLDNDEFPWVTHRDWRFHEHLVLAMDGDCRAVEILKDEFLYDYRMERAAEAYEAHKAQVAGGAHEPA